MIFVLFIKYMENNKKIIEFIHKNIDVLKQQELLFGGVFLEKENSKISICGSDNVEIISYLLIRDENLNLKETELFITEHLIQHGITVISKNNFLKNLGYEDEK